MQLNYSVKVEGNEEDEKNVYFKLRITDLIQMESREIKVRYSTLNEMHDQLINDNPYHDFPPFPKKDSWKIKIKFVGKQDNQEQIKLRETALNTYFLQLLKFPPNRVDALINFLKDGVDAIRKQQLGSLNNEFTSKQQFFKVYQKVKILEKTFFKKTYLVSLNNNLFIFNQLRLPNNGSFARYYQQYQDGHAKLTDFTYISQIKQIFQMRKDRGIMKMLWGSKTEHSKKPNLFLKMGIQVDESNPYEYIYSLDEESGLTLYDELNKRYKSRNPFQFDEILLITQSLVSGCHQLHKNGIAHKNISLKNIFLQQNGCVKLAGALEPINDFKEKFLLTQEPRQSQTIYLPPETILQISNYNYSNYNGNSSQNAFKADTWAIGICLIQICTLTKSEEVMDIQSLTNQNLNNFIKLIMETYGGGLSSIIQLMTQKNSKDRGDMTELMLQVYQTHLIPMRLELFSLPSSNQQKQIKYRLNTLDEISLKKFNQSIKENQKFPNLLYDLTINLVNQEKFEVNTSTLLDQIKIIKLRCLNINLEYLNFTESQVNDSEIQNDNETQPSIQNASVDNLTQKDDKKVLTFTKLLLQTTTVSTLTLNLRNTIISEKQILDVVEIISHTLVQHFVLDITGVQGVTVEQLKVLQEVLDNQVKLKYKIYCLSEELGQLDKMKLITEI